MSPPNIAKRSRISIDGESWYLIVSIGPDGPSVDITCPRENAPENARMRGFMEGLTRNINELFTELSHANT